MLILKERKIYRNFALCSMPVLFVTALAMRLYMIQVPNVVCWDEIHFVKMSSFYLAQKFFFDIHPPLGKVLLAFVTHLNNFNGSHEYNSVGEYYSLGFPYVELRTFCSLLSSFIPVLCFSVVLATTSSFRASLISALLPLFDNSLIVIGRMILLDSMLMFFMFLSLFCFAKSQKYKMLSTCHNIWLILSGLCLGFEMSIKLVGLFTLAFYVVNFLCKLWMLLPDKTITLLNLIKFCTMHFLCLVLIPFVVYLLMFRIHFCLISYSGPGDYLFSASFQSHLNGNVFHNLTLPRYASYGGTVALKNVGDKSYLHHPQNLDCKFNSMVTTHSYINENAFWRFASFLHVEGDELKYVFDGDVVKLRHLIHKKSLKTVSTDSAQANYDVICDDEMDENDDSRFYRVNVDSSKSSGIFLVDHDEIFNDSDMNSIGKTRIRPLTHVFQLLDIDNDCFLQSKHHMVTCSITRPSKNSLWYIEWLQDDRVKKTPMNIRQLTFLERFLETHVVMFEENNKLKAGKDDTISSPWQWFFNIPGQPILGPDYVIYLLGTPSCWWLSSAVLVMSLMFMAIIIVSKHRGYAFLTGEMKSEMEVCCWMILGWFMHYSPFFLMSRPLYFHHYFPALTFKFMAAGIAIDCFLKFLKSLHIHHMAINSLVVVLFAIVFQNFQQFSVLTYGLSMTGNESEKILNNLRWTDHWKF